MSHIKQTIFIALTSLLCIAHAQTARVAEYCKMETISQCDTSKIQNMSNFFFELPTFNSAIGDWDVSNVKDMERMFKGATSFNQDLSQWCVSQFTNKPEGFDDNTPAWEEKNKPVWGTCPTVANEPISPRDQSNNGLQIQFNSHPDLQIIAEKHLIQIELIQVELTFENKSNKTIELLMRFDIPPQDQEGLDWGLDLPTMPIRNFKAYKNGTAIAVTHQPTLVNATTLEEVTDELLQKGLSLEDIKKVVCYPHEPDWECSPEDQETTDSISSKEPDEIIAAIPESLRNGNLAIQDRYFWQQTFAPNSRTKISYSYDPSTVGVVNIGGDWLTDLMDSNQSKIKRFCKGKKEGCGLNLTGLFYLLQDGHQEPIKDFRLQIQQDNPNGLILVTDTSPKFVPINATTIEFRAKNFIPKLDLNILFMKDLNAP